ncbi:hypothetical protein [Geobacillus sp. BMUD]|nr:hypothetical protein [Geobacillus sp. BMUD]
MSYNEQIEQLKFDNVQVIFQTDDGGEYTLIDSVSWVEYDDGTKKK